MAATDAVRLGLVGYGAIGRAYAEALRGVAELTLVAVADADPAARARAAALGGPSVHGSLEELLGEHRLDAALVATPPATHEELATRLLAAGTHVLCEKPLATGAAPARRMLAAAAAARRALVMCSKFRFVPDVIEAERMVANGLLGGLVLYENVFCSRVPMAGRWNADPRLSGGGVLIDNGAHAADLARLFVGPLASVLARFGPRVQDVPVEDTVRVLFEGESGCIGTIDLSWSVHRQLDWYVAVHGAAGTLRLGWRESAFRLHDGEWKPFGGGYDKLRALRAQLVEFARVVRGEAAPSPSPDEALDSVLLIDACYESARTHRLTPLGGRR